MWTDEPFSTVAENFEILASNNFLTSSSMHEDVEKLLRSASPSRQHFASLKDRPPPGRSFLRSFSRSPSPSKIKQRNSAMPVLRGSKRWQEDWNDTFEKAEDDMDLPSRLSSSSNNILNFLDTNKQMEWSPMKANHDLSFSTEDSGTLKSHKLFGDSLMNTTPRKLRKSHSMTRLNRSINGDLSMDEYKMGKDFKVTEKSQNDLHSALEESENRRNVLMLKLKEAQTTLELQNERLNKIEASSKENSILAEDLKMKENAYRKKILHLEAGQEEKHQLKMENLRLREEMQARITALDDQLKQLKTQHTCSETENDKRAHLLNHTTTILSLLEEENAKLQQDKEKLLTEFTLSKEAFDLIKSKNSSLEIDHRNLENECFRLKDDNTALARKVQEMVGQMLELRNLLQATREENEHITSTWRMSSEDKVQSARQVEGFKDMISDLKTRLATISADRDRLFQEKLEMNSKIQQMVLEKEQLMRAKLNLEDQVYNYPSNSFHYKSTENKQDIEKTDLSKELAAVKKVCEELTSELSSVKIFHERSLEQCASLEKSRSLLQSQQEIGDQERARLQSEIDRLTQLLKEKNMEEKNDQNSQKEHISQLKSELRKISQDKNELEAKLEESNAKLAKANECFREDSLSQNTELEMWKNTSEHLTSSLSYKESELTSLTARCHQLEDTISDLKKELRILKDENENFSTKLEDIEKLKLENRCLLKEKSENDQVIKLLETQKSLLTKTSENGLLNAREVDSLKEQLHQFRSENDILRKKMTALEEQRAEQQNSHVGMRNDTVKDLDKKNQEVQSSNKDLRKINDELMMKLDLLNQENTKLKQASNSSITNIENDSLKYENEALKKEIERLKQENQTLDSECPKLKVLKDNDDMVKLRKEKDAVLKQVTLLQGQMNLIEGSKKRAEDQVNRLNAELNEMRAKINNSQKASLEAELKNEIEKLKQQLEKVREEKINQNDIKLNEEIDSIKQELMNKVTELELELDQKEKLLNSQESQLKLAETQTLSREKQLKDLQKKMKEVEDENIKLKQDMQEKKTMSPKTAIVHTEKLSSKLPDIRKSMQEELAGVLKAKQNGIEIPRSSPFRSKSLNSADLKSLQESPSEPVPEKSPADGGTKLQSLISKYRSHSDTEETGKPAPPKIGYKNRFGIKSSPLASNSETQSASESILSSPDAVAVDLTPSFSTPVIRTNKKLPPDPLPKPTSPLSTWTKSTFMRTMSSDKSSKDSGPKLATPASLRSTFSSFSSFADSSSAAGQSDGHTEDLNESQEQKDINALIQKFNEMASF